MSRGVLLLIDTAGLAFRAHYAFIKHPLTRPDGKVTSALFGYCNSILSIVEKVQPTHILAARDLPGKNFRHEMYFNYKANRPPCPPELIWQLEEIPRMSEAMGIISAAQEGFEADDIIGTMVYRAAESEMEVLILSGDKDFMQLLRPGIAMLKPGKGDLYDRIGAEQVPEVMGVRADQIIDFLALTGDASDNIPGAPGVGKVTAAKLLAEYDNLDTILAQAGSFKKKALAYTLTENRDQVILSKELVVLRHDTPGLPDLEELKFEGFKPEVFKPWLSEMHFPQIMRRLGLELQSGSGQSRPRRKESDYKTLTDNEGVAELLEACAQAQAIRVGLAWQAYPGGGVLGVSTAPAKAFALRVENAGDAFPKLLEALNGKFGAYAAKPLLKFLAARRADMKLAFDAEIEAQLLNPGEIGSKFERRCRDLFGEGPDSEEELLGKGQSKVDWSEVEPTALAKWVCQRADFSLRLHEQQRSGLELLGLMPIYLELELPLVPVIAGMERRGIRVMPAPLEEQSKIFEAELEKLVVQIHELAGREFNINSTQQLGRILFDELKLHELSGQKKAPTTKTGYSTDVGVLESLRPHPLAEAMLRYRSISKLKSTYLDALPKEIDPESGHIHASFHQIGAATGRLSSQHPNLQNIPMRSAEGARIREAFVPSGADSVLLSADYSQIELRVLAHLSEEASLTEAFESGQDIHTATAARVFGLAYGAVGREERARAKAVNFGLLYGMGPKLLAVNTGMSFEEAKDFIRQYFESFPGLRDYLKGLVELAREKGYTMTMAGRRRDLPDLRSENGRLRSAAENMALNTPIQGSAADIIKLAMVRLDRRICEHKLPLALLLQVHDELVFECPRSRAAEMAATVSEVMQDRQMFGENFKVPLLVEVKIGDNWLEAHG